MNDKELELTDLDLEDILREFGDVQDSDFVEENAAAELQAAKDLKEQIEKLEVTVKAKSGEGGRLFGSVSTKQIADQLQKTHGIKIDKRKMDCNEGIRSLGYTNVPVKLHQEVKATLKVHVIAE